MAVFEAIQPLLTEVFGPLVDPRQRLFWPFLLSSLVLAAALQGWMRRTGRSQAAEASLHEPVGALLSPSLWGHRSSILDLQLFLVKAALRTLGLVPFSLSAVAVAAAVVSGLDGGLGRPQLGALPSGVVTGVYSLVLFVVWDFSRFALHWLLHRVPLLWSFHQVHHSAEVLTPLTFYRSHPVEAFLYWLRGVLVTGAVGGLFFWAFRGTAQPLEIAGVSAVGFFFNAVGGNLRHSQVWLSYGERLEGIFLSPAQHQLHHSSDPGEYGVNFGVWLALWDRFAGSLRRAGAQRSLRYGLTDGERNHRPDQLSEALFGPFVEVAARLPGRLVSASVLLAAALALWAGVAWANDTGGSDDTGSSEDDRDSAGDDGDSPGDDSDPSGDDTGPAENDSESAGGDSDSPGDASDPSGDDIGSGGDDIESGGDDEGTEQASRRVWSAISVFGEREGPSRVAGSAHKVPEEVLERREQNNIHAILSPLPGVYVREEDGFGLRPNIGIRGASSDRSSKVTLLEDGILLAPAPYAAPAAYYFPLSTRMVGVELFKGPAAIRHGPNTIGGAINLQTRPIPDEALDGAIDAAIGTHHTWKLHGWGGARAPWGGVLLEAIHLATDGFKELDSGTTGFGRTDVLAKASLNTPMDRPIVSRWEFKGGWAREDSQETYLGLSAEDFAATPYRRYPASSEALMVWDRTQAELRWDLRIGEDLRLSVAGYHHWQQRSWSKVNGFVGGPSLGNILSHPDAGQAAVYSAILRGEEDSTATDQNLRLGTNAREFHSFGLTSTGRWHAERGPLQNDLEIGLRIHGDSVERNHSEETFAMVAGAMQRLGEEPEETARNRGEATALAVHVHDALGLGPLRVLPGLRLEVIRTRSRDELSGTETEATRAELLPGLGLYVQPAPWLGVFGGVHRGFSPVSPGQAEEVLPETSWNIEAGSRFQLRSTKIEAVGFFSNYSNLSGTCTLSSGCDPSLLDTQFNAGQVLVGGIEAAASQAVHLPFGLRLELDASYTWTVSQFQTSFQSPDPQYRGTDELGWVQKGDALPYVPEHRGAASLLFGSAFGEVELGVRGQSAMRDLPGQGAEIAEDERIDGFVLFDLSARLPLTEHLQLYTSLQNLGNHAYLASLRPYGARPGHPFQALFGIKLNARPQGEGLAEWVSEQVASRGEAGARGTSAGGTAHQPGR